MLKETAQRTLRRLGYEIRRVESADRTQSASRPPAAPPPPLQPTWPLPIRGEPRTEAGIRAAFNRFPLWHYAYSFEGGLDFGLRHNTPNELSDDPARPLQRFRHFMPSLLAACGGSLQGKRVLDIACNSGFWSLQCALLGAEVVGFDGRQELIDQANLLKSITGAQTAEFQLLDFWDMSPETLGTFDVVLNLGILYHLPKPLEALELTRAVARNIVLLDTVVYRSEKPLIQLGWEEPRDIRSAVTRGVIAKPSKAAVEMLLRHVGFRSWEEIPVRSDDAPPDYQSGARASWVVRA
jgi:tRNA (mo5U34)-methyltransferase